MANICSFLMQARGDEADLHALQWLLERGRNGNAFDGDVILEFELVFPGDVIGRKEGTGHPILSPELGHTFLWIYDRGVPPMASIEDGILSLAGTSKWSAPAAFIIRLSMEFPELDFLLSGTTEHEHKEVLQAKGGNCLCRQEYIEDIRDDQDWVWRVWDGVVLDTGYGLKYSL